MRPDERTPMRISALASVSGVSVPTIKYYIREGLVPPGQQTARNQAEYGEEHATRLRLIRILSGPGGLSLSTVQRIVAALDAPDASDTEPRRLALWALSQRAGDGNRVDAERARADVDDLVDRLAWAVDAKSPSRDLLAQVFGALRQLDVDCDPHDLWSLAKSAEAVVAIESATMPASTAMAALARTVLLEVALTAIFRMAEENFLSESVPVPAPRWRVPTPGVRPESFA
jgi:DNA-binding transcriptional MerR regulator